MAYIVRMPSKSGWYAIADTGWYRVLKLTSPDWFAHVSPPPELEAHLNGPEPGRIHYVQVRAGTVEHTLLTGRGVQSAWLAGFEIWMHITRGIGCDGVETRGEVES